MRRSAIIGLRCLTIVFVFSFSNGSKIDNLSHYRVQELNRDRVLLETCCEQIGRKQATNNGVCTGLNVPKKLGNISERRVCHQLASICCRETLHNTQCRAGVELAASQFGRGQDSTFAFGTVSCDDTPSDSSRECCGICKLAILDLERYPAVECTLDRFAASIKLSASFNATFELCCDKLKSHLYRFVDTVPNDNRKFVDLNNECDSHPCGVHQTCLNTPNGARCLCHSGLILDEQSGECRDVNECQLGTHNCPSTLRCDNTFGSFDCIRVQGCGTGYTVNADTDECEDIDECALDPNRCSAGYRCRNTMGSYKCDKLECEPNERLRNSICEPIPCRQGEFFHLETGVCQPEDPCLDAKCEHTCLPLDEKMNGVFYRCECEPGFESIGHRCLDIDECRPQSSQPTTEERDRLRASAPCPARQRCVNTVGSFQCNCPEGFEHSSSSQHSPCTDINECRRLGENDGCYGHNTTCINRLGDHVCVNVECPTGFHRKSTDNSVICVRDTTDATFNSHELFDKHSHLYYSFLSNQAKQPISFYAHRFSSLATSTTTAGIHRRRHHQTFHRYSHEHREPPNVSFSLRLLTSSRPLADFRSYFSLSHPRQNEVIVSMLKPIAGPTSIQLELIIDGYRNTRLYRHRVLLNVNISKYELNSLNNFIVAS